MSSIFADCKSLISLDLSNFNTENIKEMYFLFNNCNSLISLNLSHKFNKKNNNNIYNGCNSLIHKYLK